jgi:hypothetical protein
MSQKDVQSAQNFVSGDYLQQALRGDPKAISAIYYRAGIMPDGSPSSFKTDPAASQVYQQAAQQLTKAGITPSQGVEWKGHSHNVFSQAGRALAPVLKIAAPIAAFAIPGLGPLAAAGLAAGGTELGSVLGGQNALKALPGAALTGAATGAGRAALGALSGAAGGAAGGAAEGAGGGGLGGTLKSIGTGLGVINASGQLNPLRLAQLGLGAASLVQGTKQQAKADQMLGRATAPINVPTPDLTPILGQPYNPYSPGYQPPQGQNPAQLAALRSLGSR